MKSLAFGLAPLLLLVGCTFQEPTYPTEVTAARTPADASSGIRAVRPASVTRGYVHRVPVEPRTWRERNAVATEPTS